MNSNLSQNFIFQSISESKETIRARFIHYRNKDFFGLFMKPLFLFGLLVFGNVNHASL